MPPSYSWPRRQGSLRLEDHLRAVVLLVDEHRVAAWRVVEWQAVRDDEARVDVAVLDPLEERPEVALDVRLTGLDRDRAVHDGSERHLVEEAAVDAGDGYRAAVPARHERLAKRDRTVGLEHQRLLHAVVHAEEARHVPLETDGVDARVGAPAAGHVEERLVDVRLLVVDRLRA